MQDSLPLNIVRISALLLKARHRKQETLVAGSQGSDDSDPALRLVAEEAGVFRNGRQREAFVIPGGYTSVGLRATTSLSLARLIRSFFFFISLPYNSSCSSRASW